MVVLAHASQHRELTKGPKSVQLRLLIHMPLPLKMDDSRPRQPPHPAANDPPEALEFLSTVAPTLLPVAHAQPPCGAASTSALLCHRFQAFQTSPCCRRNTLQIRYFRQLSGRGNRANVRQRRSPTLGCLAGCAPPSSAEGGDSRVLLVREPTETGRFPARLSAYRRDGSRTRRRIPISRAGATKWPGWHDCDRRRAGRRDS